MLSKNMVVSWVLVAALMISAFPVIAADDTGEISVTLDPVGTVYYEENFESFNVGAESLSGYGGGAKGNVWSLCEESGNKYWSMSITTDVDMHLDKTFSTPASGKLVLEGDFYFEDYGATEKCIKARNSSGSEMVICKFTPDGSLVMYDGSVIAGYVAEKWYTLSCVLDTEEKAIDVYFNGKKRVSKYPFLNSSFNDISMLRYHMVTPGGKTTWRLDNLKLYQSEKPLTEEDFIAIKKESAGDEASQGASSADVSLELAKSIMASSVGLYVNKPNAYVRGRVTYITENRDVTPVYVGEETMIPLRFFAESIGASIEWIGAENKSVLKKGNTLVEAKIGDNRLIVNQNAMGTKAPVSNIGGCTFVPVAEICDAFDISLFYDEAGLIIYSEDEIDFSWDSDLGLLTDIFENFGYDNITGEDYIKAVTAHYGENDHPRLLMTEDRFKWIRSELAKGENGDIYVSKICSAIKGQADGYLKTTPLKYELRDGVRLLYVTAEIETRVMYLAMAYNIYGDERYAVRARQEMIAAANYKDWHPWHFLDTGNMTAALAFGYDWLYNWLDEGDKKLIRDAIVDNAFVHILNDFDGKTTRSSADTLMTRSYAWSEPGNVNNWRLVGGGGVGVGALAIIDDLEGTEREEAGRVLSGVLEHIRPTISMFAPEGGYAEGIGYWGYANKYYGYLVGSLITATGDDYGYTDAPGLKNTVPFLLAMNGAVSTFNYHDTGRGKSGADSATLFWARNFNEPGWAAPRLKVIMGGAGTLHDLLYYEPEFGLATRTNMQNDTLIKNTGVFSARSGWSSEDLWVGYHVDNPLPKASHGHNDVGSFVLDAMGENFFLDLGAEDYNINPYQSAYRIRAEGHNTFVINPNKDWDQRYGAEATFNKWEMKPRGSYAIADLTDVYSDYAESAWRGVKLDNYRRTVTVQDEIIMKEPSEYYWFAHTTADIEIADGGKTAYLTLNGKKLKAEITTGDGAIFTVMDAKPLPTSPVVDGANSNDGIRKLAIHIEKCSKLNLTVSFNCCDIDGEISNYNRTFVPMAEWSIPDGENVPSLATVKSISIDGKPLSGFDPNVTTYEVLLERSNSIESPVVSAVADGETRVTQPIGRSGTSYVVALANGELEKRTYTIKFKDPMVVGDYIPEGDTVHLKPVSVKASDVPQPENPPEASMDGELGTRWSCTGECWIEYDLGSVKTLDAISLALWKSTERTSQFNLEISENGITWTKVFEGDSTPSDDYETHVLGGQKARYVRMNGFGFDGVVSNWTSLLEFKIYGK